jgi:hypothetical protein
MAVFHGGQSAVEWWTPSEFSKNYCDGKQHTAGFYVDDTGGTRIWVDREVYNTGWTYYLWDLWLGDNTCCTGSDYGVITYPTGPPNLGPAFTMESNVASATAGFLGSLVAVILNIIPVAIAIVGGLVVTLFGLRYLFRFFYRLQGKRLNRTKRK